jgi:hypothetical protein
MWAWLSATATMKHMDMIRIIERWAAVERMRTEEGQAGFAWKGGRRCEKAVCIFCDAFFEPDSRRMGYGC